MHTMQKIDIEICRWCKKARKHHKKLISTQPGNSYTLEWCKSLGSSYESMENFELIKYYERRSNSL